MKNLKEVIESTVEFIGASDQFKVIELETGSIFIDSNNTSLSLTFAKELETSFFIGSPNDSVMTEEKEKILKILNEIRELVLHSDDAAKILLNSIKECNEDISIVFINKEDKVISKKDTDNLMDIYKYHNNENKSYYGVYTDLEGVDDKDSRFNTDEEMLNGIKELLKHGRPKKRTDLPSNFKKSYVWSE